MLLISFHNSFSGGGGGGGGGNHFMEHLIQRCQLEFMQVNMKLFFWEEAWAFKGAGSLIRVNTV